MAAPPSPALPCRDLPEPPARLWPLIGPGVVAAGVGLASGEFILWPFIASQVGLTLLWGAAIGVLELASTAADPRRRSLFDAEELGFEQRFNDGCTVHGDERSVAPPADVVELTGNELLARAALALDEDGKVGDRDAFDAVPQ